MSERSQLSRQSEDEVDEDASVEIKGDQAENDSAVGRLNLSSVDMWALGVCIAVSGIFYAWNVGLEAGFGSYIIGRFFITAAYIALILSISELSSGLPFAGGAYGIARVTLGPFAGYMVACYESMETVVACSALIYAFAKTVVVIGDLTDQWEPIICAIFYVVYIAIHTWGGRLFWNLNLAFAIGCLFLAVIFLLGATKHVDVEQYAEWPRSPSEHQAWFRGGIFMFVRLIPSCCNGFTCIECVNLACKDVQNPKRDIPRGFVASVLTQAAFCFAVVLVSASLYPGIFPVSRISAPLTFGYMKIFDCTLYQAYAVSLPALCASAFGRMFSYGRQISAMGRSGMLHPVFGFDLPYRNTPFNALLFGSALGYGLCLLSTFKYGGSLFQIQMTQMALLGAYASYIAQLFSFIMFKGTFSIIKREFVSPLGIPGAIYAIFWFIVCFVSLTFYQETHIAITGFAVYTGAMLIHYFTVVRSRQRFSDEEKSILFRAHLVKNNTQRAAKIRKGRISNVVGTRAAVHSTSSSEINSLVDYRRNSGASLSSLSGLPQTACCGAHAGATGAGPLTDPSGAASSGHGAAALPHLHQQQQEPLPAVSPENSGAGIPADAVQPGLLAHLGATDTNNTITDNADDHIINSSADPYATRSKPTRTGRGSFIYTVLEDISTKVAAVSTTLFPAGIGGRVEPYLPDAYSIDDIEAETFKGSVRIRPSADSKRDHPTVDYNEIAPISGAHAVTTTASLDGVPDGK